MLTHLSIRNIVLIESAEIDFADGLCVLTGETGAGKSILLDALGLVLGERADVSLIRQGENQGSVSAEFDIADNSMVQNLLPDLGLEPSENLIIRRSLSADGKAKSFINDQPVTIAALKKMGEHLVEIHGQHDQRSLQDASVHRDLLDGLGGFSGDLKKIAQSFKSWRQSIADLQALQAEIEQASREQDYLRHMAAELNALKPLEGEEESLADKRSTMMQSEKRYEILNEAIAELHQGKGVVAMLRGAQKTIMRSAFATPLSAIVEGLEKASIEAEEALYALEKSGSEGQYNPQELEQIEERLFALRAAGRKYHMPVDDLAKHHENILEKLDKLTSQSKHSAALEKKVSEARQIFVGLAEDISKKRKAAAVKLEKAIRSELAPLKMENTHFHVAIKQLEQNQWNEKGIDEVRFECATNVTKAADNISFAPLSKIASGGELSRFMLALKVALSAKHSVPTLIFDEIDTGTGGAVADAIGKRLAALGKTAQVLVVTHLPQVAARGAQHLLVSKSAKNKKITTQVTALDSAAREDELARMLAGETITPEARKAAAKLLEQAA